MKTFNGKFLVKTNSLNINISYQVINGINDYNENCKCAIVSHLDPDYYLLFGSIDLIITERGSVLSHLAIVALEYGLPIFLSEDIISKISNKGILSLNNNIIEVLK